MKTLSIKQPWAWLISTGEKNIENRTWQTQHRGPFYIHASKQFDRKGYEFVKDRLRVKMPEINEFEMGGIVGQAILTDIITTSKSRWFSGPFGFKLDNAKTLPFHPLTGKLGFFNVNKINHKRQEMFWQLIIDGKPFNTISDTIFREQYKKLKSLKGIEFKPITAKEAQTQTNKNIYTGAQELRRERNTLSTITV